MDDRRGLSFVDMRVGMLVVLASSAHSLRVPPIVASADPTPQATVASVEGPFALVSAARFLADEMGGSLPLKSGAAQAAFFLASLTTPGSLPNPFAATRWESRVFAAKDERGRIVGVGQTTLANISPRTGQEPGPLRTVTFFQNIVVARSWRRRGVATSLLDCADRADSRYNAALAVEASNEGAVRLYESRGFVMVDEPEREGMRLMLRPP